MKANELRIGNLVYVSDNLTNLIFQEITPINIHNLMHLTGWDKSPVDIEFEPIPLTKEFLLKFGFKNIDKGGNDYITYTDPNHDYYLQLDVRRKDNKYLILDNSFDDLRAFSMVDIEYVHQLQNLYFALTGNELKYEEQS
jgi:hypothetical protein